MYNENKNIFRNRKGKKSVIITYLILFLLFFLFMLYATYTYLQYVGKNNITEPNIEHIIFSLQELFTAEGLSLPFSFDVLLTILRMQITNLWMVYLGIILIVFLAMTSRPRNEFKGMEHGSARWADKYDLKKFEEPSGIPVAYNFYVPIKNSNVVANLNEIVIGGSGAGKSFRKIKPDIMQLTGSYVVTDPKGELYRDTAKMLTENGYNIRVLNLVDVTLSNSYNPFHYMTNENDVVSVCDLFMKNSAEIGEKGDFWTGSAQDLLTALAVYLFKNENETKSFGRILRLANSVRYANDKIDPTCELARCLNKHAAKHPFDVASVNWEGMQSTPQETLGSIIKTLATRLRLWSTTSIDTVTIDDEMDFDSVGEEKTAIFLIIPAARQTYRVVANIFYSQLFERLMRVAEQNHNGRLPLLVSCEIDEFANIGEIPSFNETLAVVRSYNIRICMVLQGLSHLKAIYEKTYESIIGNCDIFTFLGSKDNDTLEYISKKLGDITVRTDSKSYNRGNQGGGQDSESTASRPLLKPNEIKRAVKPKGENKQYGGSCIIFVGYEEPFYLYKYDTLNHPRIGSVGSSFEKDWHNNTDIGYVYAPLKQERIDRYNALMEQKRAQAKAEEEQMLQMIKAEAEKEQETLQKEFEKSDLSPPEPDMPETEEDNEDDEIFDVNPIIDDFE